MGIKIIQIKILFLYCGTKTRNCDTKTYLDTFSLSYLRTKMRKRAPIRQEITCSIRLCRYLNLTRNLKECILKYSRKILGKDQSTSQSISLNELRMTSRRLLVRCCSLGLITQSEGNVGSLYRKSLPLRLRKFSKFSLEQL